MSDYINWHNGAPKWLKIVMAVVFVPTFLYRLFNVIIDKAQDKTKLVYLILTAVPFIGTILWVVDIVFAALGRKVPLCFSELNFAEAPKDSTEGATEAEVIEPKKEEDEGK